MLFRHLSLVTAPRAGMYLLVIYRWGNWGLGITQVLPVSGGSGLVTKSCPTLGTPGTVACQALSMGFPRPRILAWVAISSSTPVIVQSTLGLQLSSLNFSPSWYCVWVQQKGNEGGRLPQEAWPLCGWSQATSIFSRSPTWATVLLLPLPAPCPAQHLCNIIRYQVQGLWPAEDKTPSLQAPEPSVREARHVYLQELVWSTGPWSWAKGRKSECQLGIWSGQASCRRWGLGCAEFRLPAWEPADRYTRLRSSLLVLSLPHELLHITTPLRCHLPWEAFLNSLWSCSPRHFCCRSVAELCLTLCDPMGCSTPGFPVLHYLLEFAQTYVHCLSDAI